MSPLSFASIDQLASFLHITPTMIFTIPVETSDLQELKLPPAQKMQAFASVFCFGLPHLWTICLFLSWTWNKGPYFLILQDSPG
jgi:hypothetical protein